MRIRAIIAACTLTFLVAGCASDPVAQAQRDAVEMLDPVEGNPYWDLPRIVAAARESGDADRYVAVFFADGLRLAHARTARLKAEGDTSILPPEELDRIFADQERRVRAQLLVK